MSWTVEVDSDNQARSSYRAHTLGDRPGTTLSASPKQYSSGPLGPRYLGRTQGGMEQTGALIPGT